MRAVRMSDDRGAAAHLEHRSVAGIVGLSRDPCFFSRLGVLARKSIDRAVLEAKREIVVRDNSRLVLGRKLAIAACMITVEMGVDDILDRLAAACLIDGRLDLIVKRGEFGINLDYPILTARHDDIPALTLQHVGLISEVGGFDFDFGKIDVLLCDCRPGNQQGGARECRKSDAVHD